MKTITQAEAVAEFEAQGVTSHRHYAVKCCRCGTVQSMASLVAAGALLDGVEHKAWPKVAA